METHYGSSSSPPGRPACLRRMQWLPDEYNTGHPDTSIQSNDGQDKEYSKETTTKVTASDQVTSVSVLR